MAFYGELLTRVVSAAWGATKRQRHMRRLGLRMRTVPLDQSVAMIPDGASLMIDGFMAVGAPERVIDEVVRQKKRDLTIIANDTAMPGKGIGKLVAAKLLGDYALDNTANRAIFSP